MAVDRVIHPRHGTTHDVDSRLMRNNFASNNDLPSKGSSSLSDSYSRIQRDESVSDSDSGASNDSRIRDDSDSISDSDSSVSDDSRIMRDGFDSDSSVSNDSLMMRE